MPLKRSILLIEDEKDVSDLIRDFLESGGFEVASAFDGNAGLRMAKETFPDLILLDLIMPQPDGKEVLKLLKFNSKTKDIPVIILTGLSDSATIMDSLDNRADDFLIKPFDKKLLLATINRVLKLKGLS